MMAITHFVLAAVLWFVLMGWAIHLWSVLDAAMWKPKTLNRHGAMQLQDCYPIIVTEHLAPVP